MKRIDPSDLFVVVATSLLTVLALLLGVPAWVLWGSIGCHFAAVFLLVEGYYTLNRSKKPAEKPEVVSVDNQIDRFKRMTACPGWVYGEWGGPDSPVIPADAWLAVRSLVRMIQAGVPGNAEPKIAPHIDGSIGMFWNAADGRTLYLKWIDRQLLACETRDYAIVYYGVATDPSEVTDLVRTFYRSGPTSH